MRARVTPSSTIRLDRLTLRYDGCDDDAEVRIVRIDGLGHAWTIRRSTRRR
jgi:poly(3-hydroxybutyrate) depolymerase